MAPGCVAISDASPLEFWWIPDENVLVLEEDDGGSAGSLIVSLIFGDVLLQQLEQFYFKKNGIYFYFQKKTVFKKMCSKPLAILQTKTASVWWIGGTSCANYVGQFDHIFTL